MFNPAQQLDQLATDARNRYGWAQVEGAALRGELGPEALEVALKAWSERYMALRAAGQVDEAAAIKAMVLQLVPADRQRRQA